MLVSSTAIIVDDELSGREVLGELLHQYCPDVEVLDKCKNVLEAVKSIKKHQPDVVFLDVEMPNYAGYEIVNFFEEIDFCIVFVTAYDQYAIKAFEIAAIDYVLKPIEIAAIKRAVSKVLKENTIKNYKKQLDTLAEDMRLSEHRISYLINKQRYSVSAKEIIAFEAERAYTKIYLQNGKTITQTQNLSYFEKEVEGLKNFIKIHRSWIINAKTIKSYAKTDLTVTLERNIIARLSKTNKKMFEETFV